MGKEGELWDDSALIKAFDHAISTYKVTHGVSEENYVSSDVVRAKENRDCESRELNLRTEYMQENNNLHHGAETSSKVEETASNSQVMENSPLETDPSAKLVGPLDSQNDSIPSRNDPYVNSASHGNEHMITPDVKNQNEATNIYSSEDYSLLLNKYYELEDQRQKVLQQLNQYGSWNYHQESNHQASVPQAYDTVTCYCPYGCQNWVVPCNSSQVPCSDCACSGKTVPRNGNFPEERDFVKTAMAAAERAMSSVKKEISDNADIRLNGKGKEVTKDTDLSIESNHSSTDLNEVLHAWYSAGFYTGKYLSEQSAAKRK